MYHEYGYTDFHELNLDFILREMRKYTGLKLAVAGDKLSLINDKGETINSVTVSYSTKSLTDQNGRNIDTYIFSVAGVGDTVVFTHGDGTTTAITVPYAEKSKYDLTGHEIEDYVFNTQIAGDKLRITHGDGTIVDLVIPFATSASTDADGKDLTTYAASLSVENDNICLRDAKGRLLNSVVASYATRALKDDSGNVIESSYASTLQTGTTTVILKANDGTVLSTITIPFATESSHATNSDLATLATDATNAIETVAISGDYIVFTTYGGQAYSIQSPFSVKAQKDDLGNPIKTTYVAGVTNNAQTGALEFRDAMGNIIVSLLPTVDTAVHDDYGNTLADYVKTIVASSQSDYVTVTHGDGNVDTLTINYSTTAWKDTNNNIIKNTYIKDLQVEEDVNDHHYKLVAYNGDNPQAELFRIDIVAYSAQTDINGKALTSYVADVDYNASKAIVVKDGENNTLKTLANKVANIADVNLTTPADGDVLTYDANDDEWKNKPASGGGLQPYTGVSFTFGTWQANSNTWSANNTFPSSTIWTQQDASWFRFLEPVVYYSLGGTNTYECYRVADKPEIDVGGGTWVVGDDMMSLLRSALVDGYGFRCVAYYAIPNAPDKLIEVTLELTAGAITTNTAKIVSAGNDLPYIVLGDFTSGTYTPTSGSTILSNADKNKVPVITMNGTTFVMPVAESNATSSSLPIMNKSLATLLKEASDGTLVDPCSCMVAFITPGNTWYRVQLIFGNNNIQTNQGTQV